MRMRLLRSFYPVVAILAVIIAVARPLAASAGSPGWQQYKMAFISGDGRVVDTGNNGISHSEGQGFGMLLAVLNDDRPTFISLWQWTYSHLYRPDKGLFIWRYVPDQPKGERDMNTASDGDTLIAWSLLLAGQQWREAAYTEASASIQQALAEQTVRQVGAYTVMLPGLEGFAHTDQVVINPSYFIFPAWQAFYRFSHDPVWQLLDKDGRTLLGKMRFGQWQLPTDWVQLDDKGVLAPAAGWPARFGFDAVRIPLYLRWAGYDGLLQPYRHYWSAIGQGAAPAWIDVSDNQLADYPVSPGMEAIKELTLGNGDNKNNAMTLQKSEDYYSASLHLLAAYAGNHAIR
ncbi:glycosyl hydrolase family 8 [Martelella alba]|uniref:Glucanase n=1 Tax=Martelella alba TaxID=2590451 RepID=A0ABY2SH39_9HYPH|nr:glycosyl hydrolase family 8 [Martelella alba]TKI04583.1 endoglucanase [Martelella alba]